MPCGMARLAMVIPAIRSAFRNSKLYRGPHSRIGNTYWRPRMNLRPRGWFLNCRSGSSGKKVSLSVFLNDLKNGRGGTCTVQYLSGFGLWLYDIILLQMYGFRGDVNMYGGDEGLKRR
ncbi:hypothetical protein CDL15_Pgr006329 [Punica granatum]|uniref:Uncharacterized protein n=1 Tax=Punica granatum TaxID=22663 RepID=A0A218W9M5_PUNGR|nr:hypothetical protein CDL15_Pgr006329 [Punica granatum]